MNRITFDVRKDVELSNIKRYLTKTELRKRRPFNLNEYFKLKVLYLFKGNIDLSETEDFLKKALNINGNFCVGIK